MATSDSITIRLYRPGDEAGILALFNEVFAEDDPGFRPRTMAEWRWEFLDNPAGNQITLGVDADGRIVAQYAFLPAMAHLDGAIVRCGQGIDSIVHRDYRSGLKREGAFLKVARHHFAHYGVPERSAYDYGFPNRKALRVGVHQLGYDKIASPVVALARNLFAHPDDAPVGAGAERSCAVVRVERFGPEADALWARLEPALRMATRRTSEYLNWRYADCPVARYDAFALVEPGGGWRAAWIVRRDWTGPPILALYELLVAQEDRPALARVLEHAVAHARRGGQGRVEMWIPPWSPLFAAAREQGFAAEDSLFHLCIKRHWPGLEAQWCRERWFYTIGDADVF